MTEFFKRVFKGSSNSSATTNAARPDSLSISIEEYWCEPSIKLTAKVKTPLGSNISVVNVCVDITCAVDKGKVTLQRVTLSKSGGQIMGTTLSINVSSARTGEAWFAKAICSETQLASVVRKELSAKDSHLYKIVMSKWREINRVSLSQSLSEALNSRATPNEIDRLIFNAGRGNELLFTYTKEQGASDTRHVSVLGVSGSSIRARDHEDDRVKNFRIDRISDARKA